MSYTVDALSFSYPGSQELFNELSFSLKKSEILCILGPSGCGKTTLFRLLAGLLTPQNGQIGDSFNQAKSFLFQEPRLFDHLTLYENLTLSPTKSALNALEELLESVGLSAYKDYFPDELSGGMQQRVAIVRAFLFEAELMFLDEPFKSLDLSMKLNLIDTFKTLYHRLPKTVLMITHDALDAALLADRILILSTQPTSVIQEIINPIPVRHRQVNNPQVGEFLSRLWAHELRIG
jgi:NitT/TauT family transport system ATP-binding protein